MTREEALDKLCHSYSGYFDVVRHEEPKGHLVAEAGLHIHSEKRSEEHTSELQSP